MALEPHTVGERFVLTASFTPSENMAAVPITIFLDNGISRITLRWLNGGTDGVLSADTFSVTFTKDAAWSIANFIAGLYEVRVCVGVSLTQYEVSKPIATLIVTVPRNGALYP